MKLRFSILILLLSSAAFCQFEAPNAECRLVIRVSYGDGSLVDIGHVELLDPAGKTIQQVPLHHGRASFCDFGFGEHSVVVRAGPCLASRWDGVVLNPKRTRELKVVMNCDSGEDGLSNFCEFYLRVRGEQDVSIPNASIRDPSGDILAKADSYGRILYVLRQGTRQSIIPAAPGWTGSGLTLECSKGTDYIPGSKISLELKRSNTK